MRRPGVAGVGVERAAHGDFFIVLYLSTDDPALEAELPRELEGCPVQFIHSGPFRKL